MEQGYPAGVIHSYKLYQHIKYMNLVSLFVNGSTPLEVEVAVIWTAKWGLGSILYALSRLWPFFDVPLVIFYRLYPHVPTLPNNVCSSIVQDRNLWSTVFGIIVSEIILIMMVYGLANENRMVGWWLSIQVWLALSPQYFMGQEMAYMIFAGLWCGWMRTMGHTSRISPMQVTMRVSLLSLLTNSPAVGEPELPLPTGCYVTGGKYLFAGIGFIVLALNEFILMVVVLGVGFYRYRHSNSTLVRTLYRDGIFYYVFLFLISMGEVIVLLAGPPEYADLLTTKLRVECQTNQPEGIVHEILQGRTGSTGFR
ncbi:hypothetical protein BKA70DRAFT_1443210 [Coprinopsis sp. MPI-PUGE-AT-0042]|nr:hypothetical protein BKA70DRAFT_1443210 [Coprinopsis sp. MPI-PUGE-AT-0042]